MISNFKNKFKNKLKVKGQVSVFVIIAILIVVGIVVYFVVRGNFLVSSVPSEIQPVYNYYLSCIQDETKNGALLLGQGAGYIEPPEFSPGSMYMPFSNMLDFLGAGVPYWYYISGNGIVKEQVPTKEKMQGELNNFLDKRLGDCNFYQFEQQGFVIERGEITNVQTKINDNNINVKVDQDLKISFENTTWSANTHSGDVKSNLGKLYDLAYKIYQEQKSSMFLENYGVDVLRLYAPVDGTEITCSPKIWFVPEIRNNLVSALEANTGAIKISGDYYKLNDPDHKYFVKQVDGKFDANANFLYSGYWPMKFQVWPSEDDGVMRADPVGNQEGMGILGFCYVPYHFVYDLAYPVLVQVYYDNTEIFQFPVVVYINKNKPREALDGEALPDAVSELCKYKNTDMTVYTYNANLEPVEADVRYKCFDTACDIGRTRVYNTTGQAVLTDKFPQCVNGYIIVSAPGYKTKKYIISSVSSSEINVVLDKLYKLDLEVEGIEEGNAVVTFTKDNETTTVSYPDQKEVELTDGDYVVKAYVYSSTDLTLEGADSQKCVEVTKSGFAGWFGATEEKCFDFNIPSQSIDSAISGGGKQKYYITQSELETSKKVTITPDDFGSPSKIEDLQNNYNKLDGSHLGISFQ